MSNLVCEEHGCPKHVCNQLHTYQEQVRQPSPGSAAPSVGQGRAMENERAGTQEADFRVVDETTQAHPCANPHEPPMNKVPKHAPKVVRVGPKVGSKGSWSYIGVDPGEKQPNGSDLVDQLTNAAATVGTPLEQLKDWEGAIQYLKAQLHEYDSKLQEQATTLHLAAGQIGELRNKLGGARNTIASLEARLEEKDRQISNQVAAIQQLQGARQSVAAHGTELTKLHKQLGQLKVELVEANERKMDAGRDNLLLDLEHRLDAARQEIARLKEGRFTPDELQNLCHNLDETQECAFKHGCEEYQRKLFGKEGAMEAAYRRAAAVVLYYQPRGYRLADIIAAMERDATMHLGHRVDLTDPSKPKVTIPVYSAAELKQWLEEEPEVAIKQVLTPVAPECGLKELPIPIIHHSFLNPDGSLKAQPKEQGKELPLETVRHQVTVHDDEKCADLCVFGDMMIFCQLPKGHKGAHKGEKVGGGQHVWGYQLEVDKETRERVIANVREACGLSPTRGNEGHSLGPAKEADTCQSVETLDGMVMQCGLWAGHQGPHIAKGKPGERYRWYDDASRQQARQALEEACRTLKDTGSITNEEAAEVLKKARVTSTPEEALEALSYACRSYGRCTATTQTACGKVRCQGLVDHRGAHSYTEGNMIYKWQHGACEAHAVPPQEVIKATVKVPSEVKAAGG